MCNELFLKICSFNQTQDFNKNEKHSFYNRPELQSQTNTRDKGLEPLADVDLSKNMRMAKDNVPWLSSILNDIGESNASTKKILPPISKSVSLGDLSKSHKSKQDNKKYKIRYTNTADDQEVENLNEILYGIKTRKPDLQEVNIKAKLKEFWGWHEEHKRKAGLSNNIPGIGLYERNRSIGVLEQNVLLAPPRSSPSLDHNVNVFHAEPDGMPSPCALPGRDLPAAKLPDARLYRDHTMMTWQTWRDINESDAYNNVQSYIEKNDLLNDDKRTVIRNWIDSVQCSTKLKTKPH